MTTLGLIARCDSGGLGVQTAEAFRHLHPDRTLVVHTSHRTRGRCELDRYQGANVRAIPSSPSRDDAREFMRGLDVVFTCECLYLPEWMVDAKRLGVSVVVQANPEMYDPIELRGARVVLPTEWEARRVPHESILPVPVALDRFTYRERTEARVFYHPSSPAMADRNGTALVLAALSYVRSDIEVIVRGARNREDIVRAPRRGPRSVKLTELSFTEDPYWDAYPERADVLLMPRRYGGLSLPMQESAALGMPCVTLDLPPQSAYPHAVLVAPTTATALAMKGGVFPVWDANPRELAKAIDRLASSPPLVGRLSRTSRAWAESRSWSALGEQYAVTLGT